MKRKLWLDLAPGLDGAMGLLLANALTEGEVVGISTSFGAVSGETALENALRLKEKLGLHAPVYAGAAAPVLKTEYPCAPEGEGLFRALPPSSLSKEPSYMWDALFEAANKEKLTFVALGSLTDLAISFFRYEGLPSLLEEVVLVSGSGDVGDLTAFGEANVVRDPYAMEAVLRSGAKLRMVGLDIGRKATPSPALQEKVDWFSQSLLGLPAPAGKDRYFQVAAALLSLVEPGLLSSTSYYVTTETAQCSMHGRTIVDCRAHSTDEKNVSVAMTVDEARFAALFAQYFPPSL